LNFLLLLALIPPSLAFADEPVVNEAIRKYADAVEKATAQLKTVVDADSAKKAAEMLAKLDTQAGDQRAVWLKRTEPPGAAVLKHANAITDELEIAWSRIVDNGNPGAILDGLPALRKIIADRAARRTGFIGALTGHTDAKCTEARIKALSVGKAALAFQIKYSMLPQTLQQLLEPPDDGKPFLDKEDLLDPWGLPFQYDAKGSRNNGMKPDVWSIGLDANNAKGRLGNWRPSKEPGNDK
jgi:hypothetical protein